MDKESIISEFLFGQLYLARFGTLKTASALGHFKTAEKLVNLWQDKIGRYSLSLKTNLLNWLEENTRIGVMNSQPTCRAIIIKDELDGPVDEFGSKLMSRILEELPNQDFPGTAKADQVRYRDNYLNTPFKVVLMANWMTALKKHLSDKNRWNVPKIEVETSSVKYIGEDAAYNQVWLPEKCEKDYPVEIATKDRDYVLKQLMEKFGVALDITTVSKRHDRDLTITFDDESEFQLDLGKGLSHWKAVKGGKELISSFNHFASCEDQVEQLFVCQVKAGSKKSESHGFVDWRKGPLISNSL